MLKRIKHHWIPQRVDGQNQPIAPQIANKPTAILLGAPDDRGVLNVGGRLGAGHGPAAIRQMLSQFMLGMTGAVSKVELHQGFDIPLGETIDSAHADMRHAVMTALQAGQTPIVLGGGHDYGYPHIAGASDAYHREVALINIDAHLDLRPLAPAGITSGSPFFLALENGVVRPDRFIEFGIQDHCNDESYYQYAVKKDVRIMMLDETRRTESPALVLEKLIEKFAKKKLRVVVSFDVDAVQMAYAPGVSAPQTDGYTPSEFLDMAKMCGSNPNVATVGFFEFAPPLDEQQKTARLVATAIHRFLSGLSERDALKKNKKPRNPVRRLLARSGRS